MRILQMNSYMPIRQSRIAFRGEEAKPAEKKAEKPLLQQLAELQERFAHGGSIEEAEIEYQKIFGKAGANLTTEAATLDDAAALRHSGEKLFHIFSFQLRELPDESKRSKIMDKIGFLDKTVSALIFQTRRALLSENFIYLLRHESDCI